MQLREQTSQQQVYAQSGATNIDSSGLEAVKKGGQIKAAGSSSYGYIGTGALAKIFQQSQMRSKLVDSKFQESGIMPNQKYAATWANMSAAMDQIIEGEEKDELGTDVSSSSKAKNQGRGQRPRAREAVRVKSVIGPGMVDEIRQMLNKAEKAEEEIGQQNSGFIV